MSGTRLGTARDPLLRKWFPTGSQVGPLQFQGVKVIRQNRQATGAPLGARALPPRGEKR